MSWKIAKITQKDLKNESKITQKEWELLVNNDDSFTWFEDSLVGKEFIRQENSIGKQPRMRVMAYYNYDSKKGYSFCQFIFTHEQGFISIDARPSTLDKVRKIFEVAEKLNANVYKTGVLKKRDYLETMEEKARNEKK